MHRPGQRGNKYANQPANLAWSMQRKVREYEARDQVAPKKAGAR
jgi:hypothetical protein